MSFVRRPFSYFAESQMGVRIRRRLSPFENEFMGPLTAIAQAVRELCEQAATHKKAVVDYLKEARDNAVAGVKQAAKVFPAMKLIRKGPATKQLMKQTVQSTLLKGVAPAIAAEKFLQPLLAMVPFAGPVAYLGVRAFLFRESIRQFMYAPLYSFAFLKALERDFEHFLAQDILDILNKQHELFEPNADIVAYIMELNWVDQVKADYQKICYETIAFQMAIILLHILKDPKYLQDPVLRKHDFEDRVNKMFSDKKFLIEKIVSALSDVVYKNFDKLNEQERNKLHKYFEYLAEEIVKIFTEFFRKKSNAMVDLILSKIDSPQAKSASYIPTLPTLAFHAHFQYSKDLSRLPKELAKLKVEVARLKDAAEQQVLTPIDDVFYLRTKMVLSFLYSQGPNKLEEYGKNFLRLFFSLSRSIESNKLQAASDVLRFFTENLIFTVPARSLDALLTGMTLMDKKFNFLTFGRKQRNDTLQHNKAFCWAFGGMMVMTAEAARAGVVWMFGVDPLFLSAALHHPLFHLFSAASVLRDQPLPCDKGGWDILAPHRLESTFWLKQISKTAVPILRVKENRDALMRFWNGENMTRVKIIIGGGRLRSFDTIVKIPAVHHFLILNGRDILDGVRSFEIYRKSMALGMMKALLSTVGYVGPAQVANAAEGIQLAKSPELLNQIKLLEHLVLLAERQGRPSFAGNAKVLGSSDIADDIRQLEEYERAVQHPIQDHFELKLGMTQEDKATGKEIAANLAKVKPDSVLPPAMSDADKATEDDLRKKLAARSQQRQKAAQSADSKRGQRPKSPLRTHSAIQVPAASQSQELPRPLKTPQGAR